MGQLHTHLRAPADLQVLLHRLEKALAFVADVAGVEAALLADHRAKGRELVGGPVRAGGIDETGGESDRAFVHRVREKRLHLVELVATRGMRRAAHDALPQRAVADEGAEVYRRTRVVAGVRVFREGRPRPLGVEDLERAVELLRSETPHGRRRAAAVAANNERHAQVERTLESVVDEEDRKSVV